MASTMSANEPRTTTSCLGSVVGRTTGIAIYLGIFLSFAAVHFFYATSALLDVLAVFILFLFFGFFGLSLACLTMCATVGPGQLPTRFSATRMETFIREELLRVVAKGRAAQARHTNPAGTTETNGTTEAATTAAAGTAVAGASAPSSSSPAKDAGRRWADLDDEEDHQLANVASSAAMTRRASPTLEEAEWERLARESRQRLQEERTALSSSDSDADEDAEQQQRRRQRREQRRRALERRPAETVGEGEEEGEGDAAVVPQADGSIHNSADDEEEEVQELPAYMSEMMRLRRDRKLRRGLDIVRVSGAAQRVLAAMDSEDVDHKREEMGYLIPGANWCRFCRFYQMNDTRHCPACGHCVYRAKLHCICCGTCIGYANSKYYVLFLFYLAVAFLMANFLDLYCVNSGYTYFFKNTGEANSIYYLVFVYSYALVVLTFIMLFIYLRAEGRNVGLLTELLRDQREELEAVRARNSGEHYQLVMSERTAGALDDGSSSPEQNREDFSWRRAMNAVGEGLPLPLWFWPVPTRPAVKEMDDPEGFWTNLTDAIRLRLRSVADEDDVFTDEDEAIDNLHESAREATETGASAASATAAVPSSHSAPDAPPAAAASPIPFRAKSTDVTVVPVPLAPAVAPPIAKAAPARQEKAD